MRKCLTVLLATALCATIMASAVAPTVMRFWDGPTIVFADFQREPNATMTKLGEDLSAVIDKVRSQDPTGTIFIKWVPASDNDPKGHFRVIGVPSPKPEKTDA